MNQGIYKIINTATDCFYIGSAVNLKRRNTRHFSELRTNKHNNKHLQAAWNRYGEACFVFVILEYVENVADLYVAEDKWLQGHVGKAYCYNMGMAALSPMLGLYGELSPTWGYKHTNDAKARISAASKARVQSEEEKIKRRKSMKGHIIQTATRAKISETLSGEGNFWYGKKRADHGAKVSRAVQVTDPEGRTEVFDSIQALRTTLKLGPPTVNRALKSGLPLARGPLTGWAFKYACGQKETVI